LMRERDFERDAARYDLRSEIVGQCHEPFSEARSDVEKGVVLGAFLRNSVVTTFTLTGDVGRTA
jgi:hypothetical protein